MRSIYLHFRSATRDQIAVEFNKIAAPAAYGNGTVWIYPPEKPVLFISLYEWIDMEPDDFYALLEALEGELTVSLQDDISVRFALDWGDSEAKQFALHLLNLFNGFAEDDYTNHFWTAEEIRQGILYDGLRFNDTQSWNDRYRQSQETGE